MAPMSTTPTGPGPIHGRDVPGHDDLSRTQTVPPVEHTAPVPVGAGPSAAPTSPPARRSAPRRRWSDLAIASILSAVLASGGTYAAVRAADSQAGTDAPASQDVATGSTDVEARTVSFTGEQDWASIAETVTPSVVSIDVAGQAGQGSGSGVVWDTEGHIVTNAHVVAGAERLRVSLADGRSYQGSVIGSDPSSDLAVVKLSTVPEGLTPITVGDDGALAVGDPVMAVGNPLGLSGTVTTGIVSALDRPVTTQESGHDPSQGRPQEIVTNAIQTSAAINPGNSGGALVDATGALVGINSSIASIPSFGQSQAGSIGIGFAIPAVKVGLIADQLIETGTAQHAFLGVTLDDGQAEVDGAVLTGARVHQVEPGSPAEAAGLRSGDIIVAIDGETVPSSTALVGQVRERASGQEAVLDYVRDGERDQVTTTLAVRPDNR